MALLVKSGTFTCPTTGNEGNFSVGSLDFGGQAGKVLILWSLRQTSSVSVDDCNMAFGVATSSSNRRVIAFGSDDATPDSTICAGSATDKCLWVVTQGTGGAVVAAADFVQWDENGFTLNFSTCDATAWRVHYLILGGSDITGAKLLSIQSKTSTGQQAYTGAGFQPTCIMPFRSLKSTSEAVAYARRDMNHQIGFAMGSGSGNQSYTAGQSEDAENTMDCRRAQKTDKCFCILSETTDAINQEAELVQFDSDGFTLDWTTQSDGTADYHYVLCLAGPQFKCWSFSSRDQEGDQVVTGLGFQPTLELFCGWNTSAALGVAASNASARGFWVSSSEFFCTWQSDQDGVGSANAARDSNSAALTVRDANQTLLGTADFVTQDSGGFTLNWDLHDAGGRSYHGLAIGPAATALVGIDTWDPNHPDRVVLRPQARAPQPAHSIPLFPLPTDLWEPRFPPKLSRAKAVQWGQSEMPHPFFLTGADTWLPGFPDRLDRARRGQEGEAELLLPLFPLEADKWAPSFPDKLNRRPLPQPGEFSLDLPAIVQALSGFLQDQSQQSPVARRASHTQASMPVDAFLLTPEALRFQPPRPTLPTRLRQPDGQTPLELGAFLLPQESLRTQHPRPKPAGRNQSPAGQTPIELGPFLLSQEALRIQGPQARAAPRGPQAPQPELPFPAIVQALLSADALYLQPPRVRQPFRSPQAPPASLPPITLGAPPLLSFPVIPETRQDLGYDLIQEGGSVGPPFNLLPPAAMFIRGSNSPGHNELLLFQYQAFAYVPTLIAPAVFQSPIFIQTRRTRTLHIPFHDSVFFELPTILTGIPGVIPGQPVYRQRARLGDLSFIVDPGDLPLNVGGPGDCVEPPLAGGEGTCVEAPLAGSSIELEYGTPAAGDEIGCPS